MSEQSGEQRRERSEGIEDRQLGAWYATLTRNVSLAGAHALAHIHIPLRTATAPQNRHRQVVPVCLWGGPNFALEHAGGSAAVHLVCSITGLDPKRLLHILVKQQAPRPRRSKGLVFWVCKLPRPVCDLDRHHRDLLAGGLDLQVVEC